VRGPSLFFEDKEPFVYDTVEDNASFRCNRFKVFNDTGEPLISCSAQVCSAVENGRQLVGIPFSLRRSFRYEEVFPSAPEKRHSSICSRSLLMRRDLDCRFSLGATRAEMLSESVSRAREEQIHSTGLEADVANALRQPSDYVASKVRSTRHGADNGKPHVSATRRFPRVSHRMRPTRRCLLGVASSAHNSHPPETRLRLLLGTQTADYLSFYDVVRPADQECCGTPTSALRRHSVQH
jgi:hypothetical protein